MDNSWSPIRFWNENDNSFMGRPFNSSLSMFSISPNISGKYSRLEHWRSVSVSREVNLRGGKLVSFVQPKASNFLSLFRKPIEPSTATKLSHSLNESSLKFGRSDTSGICVKNLHPLKLQKHKGSKWKLQKHKGPK